MQVLNMHKFLYVCFCLMTCSGNEDDDWIDPTDMLNYDASAGRMKHQKQYPKEDWAVNRHTEEQTQGTCQSDGLECKSSTENWKEKDHSEDLSKNNVIESGAEIGYQKCKEDLETLKQEIEKGCKEQGIIQNSCNPVFRRYLYRILNEVHQLPDETQPEIHYDAEIVLTKEMVAEMQRFLSNAEWNTGSLDEVLSRTLIRFKYHNIEEWRWRLEDYIGIDPFTAFMISLSVLCIIMIVATELWTYVSWLIQIRRLFIILFVLSIGWNWMYLYKVAFAERQAEMTKMQEFDTTCGKKVTWSEGLLAWWSSTATFQNDPCEEYFKALLINPILLVPPTKALAVTFTNFITEPLKHVGKGIGEFFHALLAEMPVLYQLPVLIIIALLLLVFCYGAGTSVHHIGLLRRNDNAYRERLPPAEPQRPAYNQYIEGGDQRYHNLQPNQPPYIEDHPHALNLRPEILYNLDRGDLRNQQQERSQAKPAVLENRTNGQNGPNNAPVMERSVGLEQKKEHPADKTPNPHQPVKDCPEELYPGSQVQEKGSPKDEEKCDKSSPVQQVHFPGNSSQLISVGPVLNMSPSSAEDKEEPESCTADVRNKNDKKEEQRHQEVSKNHTGINSASFPHSAKHDSTQEVVKDFHVQSHLDNFNSNVDMYTDPGEQFESLSFVVLEGQE